MKKLACFLGIFWLLTAVARCETPFDAASALPEVHVTANTEGAGLSDLLDAACDAAIEGFCVQLTLSEAVEVPDLQMLIERRNAVFKDHSEKAELRVIITDGRAMPEAVGAGECIYVLSLNGRFLLAAHDFSALARAGEEISALPDFSSQMALAHGLEILRDRLIARKDLKLVFIDPV